MWIVKISPSSKKEPFEPFYAKYEKKGDATKAAKALIRIAKGSAIAPSDIETGRTELVFNHAPWGISEPELQNSVN